MATVHILLADDSEDNRFLIAEYLKRSPYLLDFAENGEIALGKMKGRHYDLVLMDAHMPVMDGYEATQAMRDWERDQGAAPLPVLALTADAFKESVQQSAAAGFTAHLTKPIAKATLMDAIRQYSSPCDRIAPMPPSAQEIPEPSTPELLTLAGPISRLAPRYLKNVEKDLNALHTARNTEDYTTVQRIGHNLNGTGGSFGFPRITELGAEMERAAKNHTMDPIRASIDELAHYLEQVRSSIAQPVDR